MSKKQNDLKSGAQYIRQTMDDQYAQARAFFQQNPDKVDMTLSIPDELIGIVDVQYVARGLKDFQVDLDSTCLDIAGNMAPHKLRVSKPGTPRKVVTLPDLGVVTPDDYKN
jgi:hypothetical protein